MKNYIKKLVCFVFFMLLMVICAQASEFCNRDLKCIGEYKDQLGTFKLFRENRDSCCQSRLIYTDGYFKGLIVDIWKYLKIDCEYKWATFSNGIKMTSSKESLDKRDIIFNKDKSIFLTVIKSSAGTSVFGNNEDSFDFDQFPFQPTKITLDEFIKRHTTDDALLSQTSLIEEKQNNLVKVNQRKRNDAVSNNLIFKLLGGIIIISGFIYLLRLYGK